jgi:uncharacterized protein (TIGR00269 family)
MKCRVCRGPAIIDLPRHNANFCVEHFQQLCLRQVTKAIDDFAMASASDRVLVAVSGGKDSLAVWDILNELGYSADGLYVGLGIGEYSENSKEFAVQFAVSKGLTLHEVSLRGDYDFDVPTAAKTTGRVPCSACGMSKRHIFDQFALDNGYDVLVTGHNLDDEVSVLFGNTLRWDVGYLSRQLPVLDARGGFPKKVKPLVRLTEREMAAWCVVRNIEYIIEECPLSSGNRHLTYKDVMNQIEEKSPGTKASFYLGFLDNMAPLLRDKHAQDLGTIGSCSRCSAPTGAEDSELCAFCRMQERASQVDPIPVDLLLKKRRRP